MRLGAVRLAYPFFVFARTVSPRHFVALRFSAWCLRETGALIAAVGYYREMLKVAPTFVDGRVELGFVLSRLDRKSEALEQFERALTDSPAHCGARCGLAAMLICLNHPAEAILVCEELVRDDPANAAAWRLLARARLDGAQWNAALTAFETAQGLESDPQTALEHSFLLSVEFNRHVDAEEVLKTALVAHPSDRMLRSHLGFTLVEQRRYLDAEKLLREILREDPLNPHARYSMAFLLAESARASEASAIAEQLVKDAPDDPQMRYMLAWVALKDRRWDDARAAFEHALEIAPGRPVLVVGRATALKRLGRELEAQALVTAIVERDPSYFARHPEWSEFATF